VLRAHSADGLSAVACELETWGLLVHTAYGYLKGLAFSTYGEASILFAQNVLLLALIYKYNRMPLSRRLAAIILFGGAIAAVLGGKFMQCSCSSTCTELVCNCSSSSNCINRNSRRKAVTWAELGVLDGG
jgi:hypothetical protein